MDDAIAQTPRLAQLTRLANPPPQRRRGSKRDVLTNHIRIRQAARKSLPHRTRIPPILFLLPTYIIIILISQKRKSNRQRNHPPKNPHLPTPPPLRRQCLGPLLPLHTRHLENPKNQRHRHPLPPLPPPNPPPPPPNLPLLHNRQHKLLRAFRAPALIPPRHKLAPRHHQRMQRQQQGRHKAPPNLSQQKLIRQGSSP